MRFIKLFYSVITYVIFLAVFNYFIVFLGGDALTTCLPLLDSFKTVDNGMAVFSIAALPAGLSNVFLLLVFALQHSIMARLGFKKLLTRYLPKSAERSTYVLTTCAVLAWMYIAWQPLPEVVWEVKGAFIHLIGALFLLGAGIVLWSTFMISHWELFGLSQAWHGFRGTQPKENEFTEPAMYKYIRHPLYFGLFLVLWATPTMTVGHMLLAAVWSIYIFIGIGYEERDLLRQFGDQYRDYMDRVPQLLLFGRRIP